MLVLWLVFAMHIDAACPNLCSSHGVCGKFDTCECLKGADGEVAWTGYDCSLRTCPK